MDFTERKLPFEAAETMRLCPINTVHPYVPMLAPVYVFLRLNAKFVSVKSPMDFFTPDELKRLLPMESFFIPPCVDHAIPFRDAGRRIRTILGWKPREVTDESALPPTPYELSDALVQILGPLWGHKMAVEPFFMNVLITEMLPPIPSGRLLVAREGNVQMYETCLLRSSCAAFLSTLYGITDLQILEQVRMTAFERSLRSSAADTEVMLPDLEQIITISNELVYNATVREISVEHLERRKELAAKKILSRLARVVQQQIVTETSHSASIYGEEGFIRYG